MALIAALYRAAFTAASLFCERTEKRLRFGVRRGLARDGVNWHDEIHYFSSRDAHRSVYNVRAFVRTA